MTAPPSPAADRTADTRDRATRPADVTTGGGPRWKAALSAAAAVYPVSMAAEFWLLPRLGALPMAARDAVVAVVFSTLMTYVTLPLVGRALRLRSGGGRRPTSTRTLHGDER
ncbi:hypothetical protein [Embleya sp. NPDC001921]